MKVIIKEQIIRELEVPDNFPYYRGSSCFAYKIESNDDYGTIQITHADCIGNAIQQTDYKQAYNDQLNLKDISEQEFNKAYNKVLDRLKLKQS